MKRLQNYRKKIGSNLHHRIKIMKGKIESRWIEPIWLFFSHLQAKIEGYIKPIRNEAQFSIQKIKKMAVFPSIRGQNVFKSPIKISWPAKKQLDLFKPLADKYQVISKLYQEKIEKTTSFCQMQWSKVFPPLNKKMFKLIKKPRFIKALQYRCRHFSWRIRLYAAWTNILIKYGMQLVKNRADALGVWLVETGIGMA